MANRWDETWHRLREWTNGQGQSERLAAQVVVNDGYEGLDPSHPLGGKDGGKDAICYKQGVKFVMAVYFPRGQQTMEKILSKFEDDSFGIAKNGAQGIIFVTNQELRLAERQHLISTLPSAQVDIFHLERVTLALDTPSMASVRHQFLGIESDGVNIASALADEIGKMQARLEGLQTGGDTYCYLMVYDFDLQQQIARNLCVIRKGEFPLYDVRVRIRNMITDEETNRQWGEISAPAEFAFVKWKLSPEEYIRFFIHARNGQWHQDLQLKRSEKAACWLAATRVIGKNGRDVRFEFEDNNFIEEFGVPVWRS